MAKTKLNAKREHRIEMEVVVDAHTGEERALSWYYYLEAQRSFPFQVTVRKAIASSPLPEGEQVSVTALADDSTLKCAPSPHGVRSTDAIQLTADPGPPFVGWPEGLSMTINFNSLPANSRA